MSDGQLSTTLIIASSVSFLQPAKVIETMTRDVDSLSREHDENAMDGGIRNPKPSAASTVVKSREWSRL